MKGAVLSEVGRERNRQDDKWGEQNHGAAVWATVLGEEYGEFCEAVLERRVQIAAQGDDAADWLAAMRKEAVQCAAVAVAIVEWIDRGCPIDGTDLGRAT